MNLFDIVESSKETTTLFRGDSSEVSDFVMKATDPAALVGKGIYLSTSYPVAVDYTTKGASPQFKSDSGGGSDPAGAIAAEFSSQFAQATKSVTEAYTWGIGGYMADVDTMLSAEMTKIVGVGREAFSHPRYNDLRVQKSISLDFAKAYAYKQTGPMFLNFMKSIYNDNRAEFKHQFENTSMMVSVLDELVIMDNEDIGYVSRFRVPYAYLDRTYRVDDPMEPWVLDILSGAIQESFGGFDPDRTKIDARYNDDSGDEIWADNMNDWIDKFKTFGMRYAWGDHVVGGAGHGPSLLEFLLGTHFGQSISYANDAKIWDTLQTAMKARGLVGFHYMGGNQTGRNSFAGGSPVKHDVYSLWNESDVNAFRISSKPPSFHPVSGSLFSKIRFPSVISGIVSHLKRLQTSKYPQVVDTDIISMIDNWVTSNELLYKMEAAYDPE